jgi:hypothetical protein
MEAMHAIPRGSVEGRIYVDIFNLPRLLYPGVKIQVRLTKAMFNFYLMYTERTSISTFKFLGAKLNVRRVRPNPVVVTAHHLAMVKGGMKRFDFTRFKHRACTFGKGNKSLTLDNVIIGRTPKRIV